MTNKLLGALGLSRKAGALVAGFDAVEQAAVKKQLYCIVLARDLSPNTGKKMHSVGTTNHVEVVTAPLSMEDMEHLFGRRTGVMGVANEGLAHKIRLEINRAIEEV